MWNIFLYSYSITDGNGCTASTSKLVTEPTAITSTISTTNASCGTADGTASVSAGGGTGGYSYLWSNTNTIANVTGLLANIYSVTVTDANGCSLTSVANVANAGAPTATVTPTDVSGCFGGSNGSATVS